MVLYGISKKMLEKKEKLWKIWKIVCTLVENCYNSGGKLLRKNLLHCNKFFTTVVTIFPLDLAISFILLYETTITEKNEV